MSNSWHISDVHLSFDEKGEVVKPMHLRRWAIGAPTYVGYLEAISEFGLNKIADEDFVFITGDIVHDMAFELVIYSLIWLRNNVKGTLVICRGNHDYKWKVKDMRSRIAHLPNVILVDEGEVISVGEYTIGCFSNHAVKTHDFSHIDGRYLETAINIVKMSKEKDTTPVMISHYPVNEKMGSAMGRAGLKMYLSGHIHCTSANEPGPDHPLTWKWYNLSAMPTDNKFIEGCFFSTGTTDVVRVKCGQSFKQLPSLGEYEKATARPIADEMIILCGLPGSGKSTLAKELSSRYEHVVINQDTMGTRKACIKAVQACLEKGKSVIIDRCNFNNEQRKTWIDIAKQFGVKNIKAIELVLSADECIARASERQEHPTIKDSETAKRVVLSMYSNYTNPSEIEGFNEIRCIKADQSIVDILNQTFEAIK